VGTLVAVQESAPTCPRCGYDQSGLVAAWTEMCPLEATCTECGLLFEGRSVLGRHRGPEWSFEHSQGVRRSLWWRTSLVALRPWRLFAELRMHHVVRVRRLAVFALVWLAAVHIITSAANLVLAYEGFAALSKGGTRWGTVHWFDPRARGEQFALGLVRAVALPWLEEPMFRAGSQTSDGVGWLPMFMLTIVPALIMPLWMMIFGTTMSRARVRRVHILRGLAYTVPGACLAVLLLMGLFTAATFADLAGVMPALPHRWSVILVGGFVLGYPSYLAAWWWFFLARYLRLPRAGATVFLMMVLSMLFVVVLAVVIAVY
jgi:hypothetical protein